jgi:hypothetical protein
MPRYKLRTLLILLAVGPPVVAWFLIPPLVQQYNDWRRAWIIQSVLESHPLKPDLSGIVLIPDED